MSRREANHAPGVSSGEIRVTLRAYAELNEFLLPRHRGRSLIVTSTKTRSVKDLIESVGIPHTEVELILADGVPVDFAYQIDRDLRVSVYPLFGNLNLPEGAPQLRPPLTEIRFVCDVHLGKLVRMLRILGFNTVYDPPWEDAELAEISARDERVLLTRDRGLLMRGIVTHGAFVHSDQPMEQARYIFRRFGLRQHLSLFQRCSRCNGLLTPVPKSAAERHVPAKTFRYIEDFFQCDSCRAFYWKGSHWDKLCMKVQRVLN